MLFKGDAGIVGCADINSPKELSKICESFPLGLLASPTSLRIELAQSSYASKEIFYWEDSH